MRRLKLTWLPVSSFIATLALEAVAVALSWGLEPRYDTLLYALNTVTIAGAGALIASRHPHHLIGWVFCGYGLVSVVIGDLAQGWGLRAASTGWPAGTLGEWIALWSWIPGGLWLILTFLLFPDGRMQGRESRVVLWVGVLGGLVVLPGWALDADIGSEFAVGLNPFAVERVPTDLVFAIGLVLFVSALVASVVGLVQRFRHATGVRRQQLKWFAFAAGCVGLVLPLSAVFWTTAPVVRPVAALVLTALPIAVCAAILRYRLYDVDVVISRTVVYGALTLVLAAAYVLTALLLGTAVGRGSAWTTAGATLVVALTFRPVRDRLQAVVDRRFHRARYDALRRVAGFLEDLRAGRAAPEEVENVMREALADATLDLRFLLPESNEYVDAHGVPATDATDDHRERTPVERGGTTLGMVVRLPGTEEQRALLPRVIAASGLAIEIARLRVELRRQLEEVDASRARIVAVADDERRRIERDLHDGAQQRLVSIGLALRHAQHELRPGVAPEASRVLDGAVAEIAVAIDELRELAQGVRPAQLDAGLGPALRALAARTALPVEVRATSERFAARVETAAYFVACEGLTNAVKHAGAAQVRLTVERENGTVVVRVADDGVGGAVPARGSGLTGLTDRVVAQGGTLRIESSPAGGTTLTAEFPCAS